MQIEIKTLSEVEMLDVVDLLHKSLSPFMPPAEEFKRIWQEFVSQEHVFSVVGMIGEEIAGYGSVTIETKIRGGKMGHIEDIVSHEKFRGMGVGKAIMDDLEKTACDQGCYKIALQCKDHNIEFYERCGLSLSGVSMQKFI